MSKYPAFLDSLAKYFTALKIRYSLTFRDFVVARSLVEGAMKKWSTDVDVLRLAQQTYRETQDWDAFLAIYDRADKIYPNKLQFKRNLGTSLLSLYRYRDAVEQFEQCVRSWDSDDENSTVLANIRARLAICHEFLGELDAGLLLLQEAEKVINWDVDLIYGRILYYAGTSPDKLPSFLDEQIRLFPKLYTLYYWKGLYVQFQLHDLKAASYWYEAALARVNSYDLWSRFDPFFVTHKIFADPGDVLRHAIEASIAVGNSTKAYKLLFWSRIRLFNDAINAEASKIYIYIKELRFQKAENKALSLLRKKTSMQLATDSWILLGQAQLGQGKLDGSITSATQALKLDETSYDARDLLGRAQMQKEEWEAALNTYSKLIEMNRFESRHWTNLGLCQLELNDLLSAKFSYEQAVFLNPFSADAWVELGNIYANLSERELALSAYEKGLKFQWLSSDKRQQALKTMAELTLE
ncbi:MAG: tetratricopeptide repeat protein [Chloroflexota bacterium]